MIIIKPFFVASSNDKMNNNNDILKSKIESEDVYAIPSDYFEKT